MPLLRYFGFGSVLDIDCLLRLAPGWSWGEYKVMKRDATGQTRRKKSWGIV